MIFALAFCLIVQLSAVAAMCVLMWLAPALGLYVGRMPGSGPFFEMIDVGFGSVLDRYSVRHVSGFIV